MRPLNISPLLQARAQRGCCYKTPYGWGESNHLFLFLELQPTILVLNLASLKVGCEHGSSLKKNNNKNKKKE